MRALAVVSLSSVVVCVLSGAVLFPLSGAVAFSSAAAAGVWVESARTVVVVAGGTSRVAHVPPDTVTGQGRKLDGRDAACPRA
jgi:hypothetical protein